MPERVSVTTIANVRTSIVSYDLGQGEEPFLCYTWPRKEGPPLLRNGKGPPSMHVIDANPNVRTTHGEGLRLGTWLILERTRDDNRKALDKALSEVAGSADEPVLQKALDELPGLSIHETVFRRRMPNHTVLGMQGCGDLTMNDWKVAYVDGKTTEDDEPTIVALPAERLDLRRYSALVKWKTQGRKRAHMSIEEVRFSRRTDVDDPKNMVWVRYEDKWHASADKMEFAFSSQQIIRDGEIVAAVSTCHQFGDLRHLLNLPNLNPTDPLTDSESSSPLPRRYFGKDQRGPIWLGEDALIEGGHNLVRAALRAPITIPIPPDCIEPVLRGALKQAGYEENPSGTAPLTPGQWRMTDLVPDENTIEIYFRRNTYSWGMLGLTKDRKKVLALAADALPGQTGFELEHAAGELLKAGAHNALLIDEGWDVFHITANDAGELGKEPFEPRRQRLRAVFIFAKTPAAQTGAHE